MVQERKKTGCIIYLGYTSNMMSSGLREIIRYLVEHRMVDCIVTTTGGIEEDIMKCKDDFRLGEFITDDVALKMGRVARIGNILLDGGNYGHLEDWLMDIIHELHHQ